MALASDLVAAATELYQQDGNYEAMKNADFSLLHYSCFQAGLDAAVKALLENGHNVNERTSDSIWLRGRLFSSQSTPLHISPGEVKMTQVLLQFGSEIDAVDEIGFTTLMMASERGHVDTVRLLLQSSANVNTVDKLLVQSALILASLIGNSEVVQLLLEFGANIEAADKNRWTSLMWASQRGHGEAAQRLVQSGANLHARDSSGGTSLMHASAEGKTEVVRFLLHSGSDLEAREIDGQTPLFRASSQGHLDTVELLLRSGANITAVDNSGQTALFKASQHAHLETVKLLLSQNADPLIQDRRGKTALDVVGNGHIVPLPHSETVRDLLTTAAMEKSIHPSRFY